jgi:hypothetical protein
MYSDTKDGFNEHVLESIRENIKGDNNRWDSLPVRGVDLYIVTPT